MPKNKSMIYQNLVFEIFKQIRLIYDLFM